MPLTIEGILNDPGYIVLDGVFMWLDSIGLASYNGDTPNDPRFELRQEGNFLGKPGRWRVGNVQPGIYTEVRLSVEHLCYGKGAGKVPMMIPSAVRWGDVIKKGTVRMATEAEVESYYRSLRHAVATFLMELTMGSPGASGGGFGPNYNPELQMWLKGKTPLHWEGKAGVAETSGCYGTCPEDPKWWEKDFNRPNGLGVSIQPMPFNYAPAVNVPESWKKQQLDEQAIHVNIYVEDSVEYLRKVYQMRDDLAAAHGCPISLELQLDGNCRFSKNGIGIATCLKVAEPVGTK